MINPSRISDVQNDVLNTSKKTSTPKSILRTANILTCLSRGITSITEIASICQTNKSTVHRLLQALGETGLTIQDPINHKYYIGPLITEIASNPYVTHEHLLSCAINEMRSLASFTGESIGLSVLIGLKSYLIHEIESIHDFAITAKHKINNVVYAGAHSKAMLSQLSNRELDIVMANLVLEPLTKNTVGDKGQLLEQLKQIRRQGYISTCGEINAGAMCISVPITNYILPTALSILGPESRMKQRENEYISEIVASRDHVHHNVAQIFQKTVE